MNKIIKRFHSGQRGFTLIELLVVIAIIAILAAIIVPNIGEYVGRGTAAAEKSELALVRNAVAAVMAAGGCGDLSSPPSNITVTWDVADTISATGDLTLTDNMGTPADASDDVDYAASDYFANGLADLKGTYPGITAEGYVPEP